MTTEEGGFSTPPTPLRLPVAKPDDRNFEKRHPKETYQFNLWWVEGREVIPLPNPITVELANEWATYVETVGWRRLIRILPANESDGVPRWVASRLEPGDILYPMSTMFVIRKKPLPEHISQLEEWIRAEDSGHPVNYDLLVLKTT